MRVGGRSGGGFPHCIFQRGGGEVGHDAAAGGQLQAEAYEQFGHPALGARDAAQSHVRHLLAAAHGQPKALSLPKGSTSMLLMVATSSTRRRAQRVP